MTQTAQAVHHYHWRVMVDYGGGETLIHEGKDTRKVYVHVGQQAIVAEAEQIIVYRDNAEYRRYELKRATS